MEIRLSLSVPEPLHTVARALTDPTVQLEWMPSLASSRLLAGAPAGGFAQYAWTVWQPVTQHALSLGEMAVVERREIEMLVEAEVAPHQERITFQIAAPKRAWVEVTYMLQPTEDGGTLVDVTAHGETAEALALLPLLAPEARTLGAARPDRPALRLASEEPVLVDARDEVVVLPLRRAA